MKILIAFCIMGFAHNLYAMFLMPSSHTSSQLLQDTASSRTPSEATTSYPRSILIEDEAMYSKTDSHLLSDFNEEAQQLIRIKEAIEIKPKIEKQINWDLNKRNSKKLDKENNMTTEEAKHHINEENDSVKQSEEINKEDVQNDEEHDDYNDDELSRFMGGPIVYLLELIGSFLQLLLGGLGSLSGGS